MNQDHLTSSTIANKDVVSLCSSLGFSAKVGGEQRRYRYILQHNIISGS